MKKVLLVTDDILDSSSYYRLLWPYTASAIRKEFDVRVLSPHASALPEIMVSDILVFGRPVMERDLSVVKIAREMNKKVVLDFDDNYLEMHETHGSFQRLSNVSSRNMFREMGALAHTITVSTSVIAKSWENLAMCPIVHIENAFNDELYCLPHAPNVKSNVVLWRGSYTHLKDAEKVAHLSEIPGLQMVFMGSVHHSLPDRFPKATFIPFQGMRNYLKQLKQLHPKVVVVPLEDTPFNRGRSNCAWIEATYAGAVTCASTLPEFNQLGIRSLEEVETVLRSGNLTSVFNLACESLPKLSRVNEKRLGLLRTL